MRNESEGWRWSAKVGILYDEYKYAPSTDLENV
jgi:hypothetical protein